MVKNESYATIPNYYLIPVKASLSLISIILNGYIIALVVFIIKKKSYSNYLFMCGALADFMVGSISVPFFTVLTTYGAWPLGKAACMTWQVIDASASSIGVHSPLIIAVHRFIQIRHASKVSEKMTRNKYVFLFVYWLFVYAFWAIILIWPNANDPRWADCSVDSVFEVALVVDLVCYIMPLVLLLVFNTLILFKIIERSKKKAAMNVSKVNNCEKISAMAITRPTGVIEDTEVTGNSNTPNQPPPPPAIKKHALNQKGRDIKAILCLYVLAGNLIVLYAWYCVTWPIYTHCQHCISESLYSVGYWLSYLYPCTNPILLLIFHEKFKTEFLKTMRKIKLCF